jgi:sugar lactone lactonase YvrE
VAAQRQGRFGVFGAAVLAALAVLAGLSIATPVLLGAAEPGELVRYTFSEGSGGVVRDTSGAGTPLDLTIDDPAAAVWTPAGLALPTANTVRSAGPATRVTSALRASGQVTVEAWITPQSGAQSGPARIVSLSPDSASRDLTLGQGLYGAAPTDAYSLRLRTTDAPGGSPELLSPAATVATRRQHVVVTATAGGTSRLYVDGVLRAEQAARGTFAMWADYPLVLGNEASGGRAWLGTFHRLAMFDRAMTAAEVAERNAAGPGTSPSTTAPSTTAPSTTQAPTTTQPPTTTTTSPTGGDAEDALVHYDFTEGSGAVVRDRSRRGSALDLTIDNPAAASWNSGGLSVPTANALRSPGNATKVTDAVRAANAVSIEAWVTPSSLTLSGPARIVTISPDTSSRNLTLGQGLYGVAPTSAYSVRVRASQGGAELIGPAGSLVLQRQHVVVTASGGSVRVYLNGSLLQSGSYDGDLSTWAAAPLTLANEATNGRPWTGTFRQVAIFDRALPASEVAARHAGGPRLGGGTPATTTQAPTTTTAATTTTQASTTTAAPTTTAPTTTTTTAPPPGGTIQTVIGQYANQGTSGDGGPATSATLSWPHEVQADRFGNVYVSDYFGHTVRKVDPSGRITTVAGTGVAGYSGDGGQATSATLRNPVGLAIDAAGNLFIADHLNHVIRRVDTAGTITTYAGQVSTSGGYGGDDGPASQALFNYPEGLALDAAGNLFIADFFNHRVRRVDAATRTVTTVAGTGSWGSSGDGGPANQAAVSTPAGVLVDPAGYLYISEVWADRIRKVSPAGTITTFAGTGAKGFGGDGGPATAARFDNPDNLAIDAAGNLYVSDISNHRVRRIAASGIITTVAGTGAAGFSGNGGDPTAAAMNNDGIAIDSAGRLLIAEPSNRVVRRVG